MSSAIEKIIPDREWEIIKFATHHNKPDINEPYPEHIVNRRTLLLFAQRFLAEYRAAKTRKYKDFFRELYRITMKRYFVW